MIIGRSSDTRPSTRVNARPATRRSLATSGRCPHLDFRVSGRGVRVPTVGSVLYEAHHCLATEEWRIDPRHCELLVGVTNDIARLHVGDAGGLPIGHGQILSHRRRLRQPATHPTVSATPITMIGDRAGSSQRSTSTSSSAGNDTHPAVAPPVDTWRKIALPRPGERSAL